MDENDKRPWVKILIVILIAIIVFTILINFFEFETTGYRWMGGMMGFGWPFMFFPALFIIIIIIVIIVTSHPSYEGENAQQILERRYASGEISRDDYLKMKRDLNLNSTTETKHHDY
jgi:putative membrane protein